MFLRLRIILISLLLMSFQVCEAQSNKLTPPKKYKKTALHKIDDSKSLYSNSPRYVIKAQREAEKKEKEKKKLYEKFIRENRKHYIEIQTPDVQKRMKQNRRDADKNFRLRRKHNASNSKKARKRYK